MKPIYIFFLCLISFVLLSQKSAAQITYSTPELSVSTFDTDIRDLRFALCPTYDTDVDTYLQFVPITAAYGMKIFGYDSRSDWNRLLVSDAFSLGALLASSYGLKYSVGRIRPDGTENTSFPSGHTARAFASAAVLAKEYGWRSPLFSIGGYTVATATALSRVMNDRHWFTDVLAGAAIGVGSVYLGYFITDKIFKDKHLYSGYDKPEFDYDPDQRHYTAELYFGRRFILGNGGQKAQGFLPKRGSFIGLQTDIPLIPESGISARLSAGTLKYSTNQYNNMYAAVIGGFWNNNFTRRLELQTRVGAGPAWTASSCGLDVTAGASFNVILGNNFKVRAFADYEGAASVAMEGWMNSVIAGFSAGWFL